MSERGGDGTRTDVAHDVGLILRVVVIVALVLAIVLVALDNRDDVRLGYVFGDGEAPLWLAIAAAAIAGALIGWIAAVHRPRR